MFIVILSNLGTIFDVFLIVDVRIIIDKTKICNFPAKTLTFHKFEVVRNRFYVVSKIDTWCIINNENTLQLWDRIFFLKLIFASCYCV